MSLVIVFASMSGGIVAMPATIDLTNANFVFYGDSKTWGYTLTATPYPAQILTLEPLASNGSTSVNRGHNGWAARSDSNQSASMWHQFDVEVTPYHRADASLNILVMEGTANPLQNTGDPDNALQGMLDVAALAVSKNQWDYVLLQSCMDNTGTGYSFGHALWDEYKDYVNAGLEAAQESVGFTLIKLYEDPLLDDASNTTYFLDGLHENDNGTYRKALKTLSTVQSLTS